MMVFESRTGHRGAEMLMRVGFRLLCLLPVLLALSIPHGASARHPESGARSARVPAPGIAPDRAGDSSARHGTRSSPREHHRDSPDTLWIFDADFEDLEGDNAGWVTTDVSGHPPQENYWHKDTIRIRNFAHLGDSTWWCGTYNDCWRQPRGYGNNWIQYLDRFIPLADWSDVGDYVTFEWDQRFALEHDYDYGFADFSADYGATWTTLAVVANNGFAGKPGPSSDWDHVSNGHRVLDLSQFAGRNLYVRFRVESDEAYSSEDQYNNPPQNSVLDGAWQLDNFNLEVDGDTVWFDDCEAPGDNGWVHGDLPGAYQTDVVFRRLFEPETFRGFYCDAGEGWMMAAVDEATGRMVDGQFSWLTSPAIDISGAETLVGQWKVWVDLPRESNDIYNMYLASKDLQHCVTFNGAFVDEEPGWWYGGPGWETQTDRWDPWWVGRNWLAIRWAVRNDEPPDPGAEHMAGFFLDRQRVGIPAFDPETRWEYGTGTWRSVFNDWFQDELYDAYFDSAFVLISDPDAIVSADVVASNDGGATWGAYPMHSRWYGEDWWVAPPPLDHMVPGSEVLYYFEATDGLGNTSTLPENAPDECYDISVLPITGSVSEPGILLVDKHGAATPGERRDFLHGTEHYFREALDILGYEYDVYDVEDPSVNAEQSSGPDTAGMKYYDTQIWFTGDSGNNTVKPVDQLHLMAWLAQAEAGHTRNLLLTGNDIGAELMTSGRETLGFYGTWLASEFISDGAGTAPEDTLLDVRDAGGGFEFMRHDDALCVLRGGCPVVNHFDVVAPVEGIEDAELVVEYVRSDASAAPAGVAYSHPILGYRTVNLGFGMEFMMDALLPTGHYATGIRDRVDLMANIMEYFEREPTGQGTGVAGAQDAVTRLGFARPNPFNPVTTIEYALAASGHVTIRVYDAAGRVVRTLVNGAADAGGYAATWDGTTDGGDRIASGVYFVRMETGDGFRSARKMVLLK